MKPKATMVLPGNVILLLSIWGAADD